MPSIHSLRYIGFLGQTFSPFESQLVCALVLYIQDDKGRSLTDDVLKEILQQRRGGSKAPLRCRNFHLYLSLHPDERLRQLYCEVEGDRGLWEARAIQAFSEWLALGSMLVEKMKTDGRLAKFHDAQGRVVIGIPKR